MARSCYLTIGVAGAALALAGTPSVLAQSSDKSKGLCVTVCNHWSYTGIGWQLGIESDVLSATDAMEMSDRAGVKTCLELDARAYEVMAKQFPEVAHRLSRYLAQGKIEIVGGAYGQPMGCMFSGESAIRQVVFGRKAIKQAFGYDISTFLEEEEFTFPTLPQLLRQADYRYASLAQVDTWGRAGVPTIELNSVNWEGKDGTKIPSTPKNALFRASTNWSELAKSPGYLNLSSIGTPLLMTWEEFGWEPPEQPTYLSAPPEYRKLAASGPIQFVTLKEYMDNYCARPLKSVFWNMDAWNKSLTWGLGGDQLRIYNNKVEGTLQAAERFDAIASLNGGTTQATTLEAGWKNLLASQSHDVGLCEYSRWQQDRMAPLDRVEDHHNFTWGALGYNLLDQAQSAGKQVLDRSLKQIVKNVNCPRPAEMVCTVFNSQAWARSGLVETDRLYPVPAGSKGVDVLDASGRLVPSQVFDDQRDVKGNLQVLKVAFQASDVPSVGYTTYYLRFKKQAHSAASGIKTGPLSMENRFLRVSIDPRTGAVSSLVDKRTGHETLAADTAEYPVFHGKPNTSYPLRANIPAEYDSSMTQAEVSWVESGPVRATVKARRRWNCMLYETYITLSADTPWVEVTSRVLPEVPPMPDVNPPDIKEGYWMSFAPAFHPNAILRDYPLAVEATQHNEFHALNFVDLVGSDESLLVLHPGTQYFRLEPNGAVSNLLMREWESHFTGEYGWPRYAEYHHALMPHGQPLSNARRSEMATEFKQPLIAMLSKPHPGKQPPQKSFLSLSTPHADLMAFRRLPTGGVELRLSELEGAKEAVTVSLPSGLTKATETNLMGRKLGRSAAAKAGLRCALGPWRVRTFELR